MHLGALDIVLAILTCLSQLILLFLLFRRGHWTGFPMFCSYIFYAAVAELSFVTVDKICSRRTYFVFYWAAQGMYTILGLAAMDESIVKVLRSPFVSTQRLRRIELGTVTLVFILVAWLWIQQAPIQASYVMTAFICFDLAADYMRAAVFGFFVIGVVYWRPQWSRYAVGIMRGFGLFSIVGSLAGLMRSVFGIKANVLFAHAPSVAYIFASFIWLAAFVRPDPPVAPKARVNRDEIVERLGRLMGVLK
ncbi:MAG: hypothetical protein JWQ87_5266 [Candidatus Sulfotelmatobacter sp.]|nr:hypothetical protein [Candidatus Sulfotelmatobacter sp.]